MPEATVLYVITAAVVAGLVVWVAVVLKTAKEPWSRAAPASGIAGAVEAKEAELPPSSSLPRVTAGSATGGADATTDATPVVVEQKKSDDAKKPEPEPEEKKPAEKKPADDKLATEEEKLDDEKKADEKKA
jgi:hypothetical protein